MMTLWYYGAHDSNHWRPGN